MLNGNRYVASKEYGELIIPVECKGTDEMRKMQSCRLGCEDCPKCEYLIWKGDGIVYPMPEPFKENK